MRHFIGEKPGLLGRVGQVAQFAQLRSPRSHWAPCSLSLTLVSLRWVLSIPWEANSFLGAMRGTKARRS